MEKKTLNVVCATKLHSKTGFNASLWHLNIAGKAVLYVKNGLIIFQGEKYSLIDIRPGLDESAAVYRTRALETGSIYDLWDLYTDIPYGKKASTPEHIRANAKATVERTESRDEYWYLK